MSTPIPISKYNPNKEGLERWFGSREASVLEVLWAARAERTIKQVLAALASAGDRPAYTTVMTTMRRLVQKGVITRRPQGRGDSAHLYAVRCSEAEFVELQTRAIRQSLEGR